MKEFTLELTQNKTYEVANYEALVEQLQQEVENYRVENINEDTYKLAKDNKAKLNKLSDMVNNTRIATEKAYMMPFNKGKEQCNTLIAIIEEVTSELEKGIKEVDMIVKDDKYKEIETYYNSINDTPILFEKIVNKKWLNKTTKMEDIKNEINLKISAIKYDFEQLKSVSDNTTYSLLIFLYIENNLDLSATLQKYEEYITLDMKLKSAI